MSNKNLSLPMDRFFLLRPVTNILLLVFFGLMLLPTLLAIPGTPHYSFFYIIFLFIFSVINPSTLLNKKLVPIYLFPVVHFLYESFDLYLNSDERNLLTYFIPLLTSVSFLEYFKRDRQNFSFWYKLVNVIILLIVLTSITSVLGLSRFPSASRAMAGSLSSDGDLGTIRLYMLMGIAHYSFFSVLCFLLPVFLVFSKRNIFTLRYRLYFMGIAVLSGMAIYYSGFGTLLFLMIFSSYVVYMHSNKFNKRRYLVYLICPFIFVYIFSTTFTVILKSAAETIDSEYFSPRIKNVAGKLDGSLQVGAFVETDLDLQDGDLYLGGYQIRAARSFESFKANPFIGGGPVGGHHFFIDLLGAFGLIGFFLWVWVLRNIYVSSVQIIPKRYQILYLHCFVTFLLLGIVKTVMVFWFILFISFVIPSILLFYEEGFQQSKS